MQDPKVKGIDVRKALLEFHSKYYSANLMKLTLIGKGIFALTPFGPIHYVVSMEEQFQ